MRACGRLLVGLMAFSNQSLRGERTYRVVCGVRMYKWVADWRVV